MNNAKLYVIANEMQRRDAEEFLKHLKNHLTWSENERVLDVGSGPGDITANMLKKVVPQCTQIIGTDISAEMVDYANSLHGSGKLVFKVMDIQSSDIWTKWERESFNKIFSFYCFHWVQNQSQAVENLYSLLKPNGQLSLIFLAKCPIYDLYEALSKTAEWSEYMKDVHKYISPYYRSKEPAHEFDTKLKRARFSSVKVYTKRCSFIYTSMEAQINSINAVNPFLKRIPENLRGKYTLSVIEQIESLNLSVTKENGEVEFNYTLLVATAVK